MSIKQRIAIILVLSMSLASFGCNIGRFLALTATATPTQTPTSTYTPTMTHTPTLTRTPTMTHTPTLTRTPTPTRTLTPTHTLTPTYTLTPTDTLTPSETPIATDTPVPSPTPIPSRGDLHLHTTCSDGQNTYEEIVQEAIRQGFSFIAITDHRFGGMGPCLGHACNDQHCAEVIAQCRNETRLLCVPGMEVSGRLHVLAIGIQQGINEWLPLADVVRQIHMQGGLAIAAHPYLAPWVYTDEELYQSGFDAMECGYGYQANRLPCVFNSDAHIIANMNFHNVCYGSIRTFDDLKTAIVTGQCRHSP